MIIGDGVILGFAASPAFVRDGICFAADQNGLLKTADHGRSWQSLSYLTAEAAAFPTTAVAVSPSFDQDGTLLAAIPGGIGRSADAGTTWRFTTLPPPPPLISSLVLSPAFGRDGYAFAGSLQDGVLQTDDGGESWQAWNAGLFDHEVLSLAISPAFATDRTLFAGTGTGLFRSRNAGRSWQPCRVLPDDPATLSLATGPDGALFAGTEENGLWRSLDQGETWLRIGGEVLAAEIRSVLVLETGATLVVSERFAARSDDGGETWTELTDLPVDEKQAFIAMLAGTSQPRL